MFVTAGLLLGRAGAVAAAASAGCVAVLLLASPRPEGDLVVPGSTAGYVWLLGGTLLAGGCMALPYRRRPRPARRAFSDRPAAADDPHMGTDATLTDAAYVPGPGLGDRGRRRRHPAAARLVPLRGRDGRRRRGGRRARHHPGPRLAAVAGRRRQLARPDAARARPAPAARRDHRAAGTSARLVVLARGDVVAGVVAEAVPGVYDGELADPAPPPPTLTTEARALVVGQVVRPAGPVAVLDAAAVLALRERVDRRRHGA